jgi:hypothetical protein
MRRLIFLSLMLINMAVSGQSTKVMEQSRTAKDITIRKDTVSKRVFEQKVYQYKPDTAYVKQQDATISKLDSIIKTKKKIK